METTFRYLNIAAAKLDQGFKLKKDDLPRFREFKHLKKRVIKLDEK